MKQRRARAVFGILAAAACAAASPALSARAQDATGTGTTNPSGQNGTGANPSPNPSDPLAAPNPQNPGSPQPAPNQAAPVQTYPESESGSQAGTRDTGMSVKNMSDRQVTSRVRESIMEGQSSSTSFHGVKVKAKNGKITLKGKVRSQQEKDDAAARAAAVVGSENVVNEIKITQ